MSHELAKYIQFEKTPEYEMLDDKKKVRESELLKTMKHFEASKSYKTYLRFHESFIIKEYEELKIKVQTQEFKKENEFWANNSRWTTTEDYNLEQRFNILAKNPDIIFFENENTFNLNYNQLSD